MYWHQHRSAQSENRCNYVTVCWPWYQCHAQLLRKKTCYHSVTSEPAGSLQSHSNLWLFNNYCTELKGKIYFKKWSLLTKHDFPCQPIWMILFPSISPVGLTNLKESIQFNHLYVWWMSHCIFDEWITHFGRSGLAMNSICQAVSLLFILCYSFIHFSFKFFLLIF